MPPPQAAVLCIKNWIFASTIIDQAKHLKTTNARQPFSLKIHDTKNQQYRRLSNNYSLNEELKDMKKALSDKIPG